MIQEYKLLEIYSAKVDYFLLRYDNALPLITSISRIFLNKKIEFNTDKVTGTKEKFTAIVEKVNEKSLKISGFPQIKNNLKISTRELYASES
jgi:hypothetical protein